MARRVRKSNQKQSQHRAITEIIPDHLLLEILSRLGDSSDLARCRLTCKTLNSLSYHVTTCNLSCSRRHFDLSRADPTSTTPFKAAVTRFIARMSRINSVSLGVDDSLIGHSFDDYEDEMDDLHLTDVGFVSDWVSSVQYELKSLSITDFWVQASWRRSQFLALISKNCQTLSVLRVKNAWLSMEGVNVMSSLTSLTLENVILDDENLSKLNESFPCLETLTLVGIGGLSQPKISLQHLKSCRWTVSDAPSSLSIEAPNLIELKLVCVKPKSLLLRTPLMLNFHLTIEKTCSFDIGELPCLQTLCLQSRNLDDLLNSFPCSLAVKEALNRARLVNMANHKYGYSVMISLTEALKFRSCLGSYSELKSATVGKH